MAGRVTAGIWWEDGDNRIPGSNEVLQRGWFWDDVEDHGGALTPRGPYESDDAAKAEALETFTGCTVTFEDRRPDYYTMRETAQEQDSLAQTVERYRVLRNVPLREDAVGMNRLAAPFEDFPVGTDIEAVWEALEADCPEFSIGDAMQGKYNR